MFLRLIALIALCAFVPCAGLHAQVIVLKDGNRIAAGDLTIGDGKISRTITLSNGQKGQASVPFSDIIELDWQTPKQISDAHDLMAAGKSAEAAALLHQAKDYFRQFKDIKGNPYKEVVFSLLETLDQAGDFDAILKVMPEVNAIKWEDDKKMALRII